MMKFRMIAMRETPWHDRMAQPGETVMVIATKTEAEARWFFGRIEWSAWRLEVIADEPIAAPRRKHTVAQEQPA